MAKHKAKTTVTTSANGDVEMVSSTEQTAGGAVEHQMSGALLPDEDSNSDEPLDDFDGLDSDGAPVQDDSELDDSEFDEMDDVDDMDEDDASDASDASMDGGIPISKGRAISPSAIPFSSTAKATDAAPSSIISTEATSAAPALLNPEKPTPYVPDAGHLLITDPNPLNLPPRASGASLEAALSTNARDAAQALLNHLLTTCPIHSVPVTATSASGITMTLPPPVFQLPREKKIPVPKPPTKWEQFAAKKGIGKNKKAGGVDAKGDLRGTEGKMVYDEASGEWVHKWGYKGRNKKGEGDWLVEVDEKKEAKNQEPADPRAASRAERKVRIKRNERAQRANERRGRKPGA